MIFETDCPPIHDNSGHEFTICEERTTERPKEEETDDRHLRTATTSIDLTEITDSGASASASTTCASCLCDDCANFAVTFRFRYNNDETELLCKVATHEILHHRKLHLVLNLNHTLLRLASIDDLTLEEVEYLDVEPLPKYTRLVEVPFEKKRVYLKLRPFVQTFLKEASEMSEMNVYSNAPLPLVRQMIRQLDPRKNYFGSRVSSRDDFCSSHPKDKCLDVLLAQESAILILDMT
ncbi:RNA polymerase II C-terminal domain phosphatase-like 5 [Argentina anserina]|uniref:RNA polymerase II C-terminal domain phosphatase-like 5 n=1 Tax=Argentina anserina TaxID=57926 RepID=UPI00217669DE|nr:RNA polymerase II C-terminal domain phosphatase-like 5 [Potentilla anserina]